MMLLICLMLFAAGGNAATTATLVKATVDEPIKLIRVDDNPVRFVAEWTQQMPTPGYTFELDTLNIDGDRIVAELTEIRPTGLVVQVQVPGTAEIPLGVLPPGRYFLEIRSRRDPNGKHRPAFAAVVNAY